MLEWILFFAIIAAATSSISMCLLIWHLFDKVADDDAGENDKQIEPVEGGMNLMLMKPKIKNKQMKRRFTDRSREWLTAHENESRR